MGTYNIYMRVKFPFQCFTNKCSRGGGGAKGIHIIHVCAVFLESTADIARSSSVHRKVHRVAKLCVGFNKIKDERRCHHWIRVTSNCMPGELASKIFRTSSTMATRERWCACALHLCINGGHITSQAKRGCRFVLERTLRPYMLSVTLWK